jgi:hypothetical protein
VVADREFFMPIHKELRQRPLQSAQDWMPKTAATTSGDVFYSSAASSSSSTVTMEIEPRSSIFNDLGPLYLLAEQALIEREPLPVDDVPEDEASRDDLGIPPMRTQLQEQEEHDYDLVRGASALAQAAEIVEGAQRPKDETDVSQRNRAPSQKRPPQVVSWRNGFPQHASYGHNIPQDVQNDLLQDEEPETTPSRRKGVSQVVSEGSSAPQENLQQDREVHRVSCDTSAPAHDLGAPLQQEEKDLSRNDLNLNKPSENSEDLPNCFSEPPKAETNEKAVPNIELSIELPQQAEEDDSSCDELNMNKPRRKTEKGLPKAISCASLTMQEKPLETDLKLSPETTSEEAFLDYKDAKQDISKKSSDDDSWKDAISDFVAVKRVAPLARRGQRQRSPRRTSPRSGSSSGGSLISVDSALGVNGFTNGSRIKKVRKFMHFIADHNTANRSLTCSLVCLLVSCPCFSHSFVIHTNVG